LNILLMMELKKLRLMIFMDGWLNLKILSMIIL